MFFVLIPAYGVKVLGLKAEETSFYLVAPLAVGIVAGAGVVSQLSRKYTRQKTVNVGILLASGGFLLLSLSQRIPIDKVKSVTEHFNGFQHYLPHEINKFLGIDVLLFVMVFMFIIGIANAFVVIVNNTYLQNNAEQNMIGRVYGVLQTISVIVAAIPVLTIGFLADHFGVAPMVALVGIIILMAHIVIRLKYKKPIF